MTGDGGLFRRDLEVWKDLSVGEQFIVVAINFMGLFVCLAVLVLGFSLLEEERLLGVGCLFAFWLVYDFMHRHPQLLGLELFKDDYV